jgi:hypothetical protein
MCQPNMPRRAWPAIQGAHNGGGFAKVQIATASAQSRTSHQLQFATENCPDNAFGPACPSPAGARRSGTGTRGGAGSRRSPRPLDCAWPHDSFLTRCLRVAIIAAAKMRAFSPVEECRMDLPRSPACKRQVRRQGRAACRLDGVAGLVFQLSRNKKRQVITVAKASFERDRAMPPAPSHGPKAAHGNSSVTVEPLCHLRQEQAKWKQEISRRL